MIVVIGIVFGWIVWVVVKVIISITTLLWHMFDCILLTFINHPLISNKPSVPSSTASPSTPTTYSTSQQHSSIILYPPNSYVTFSTTFLLVTCSLHVDYTSVLI